MTAQLGGTALLAVVCGCCLPAGVLLVLVGLHPSSDRRSSPRWLRLRQVMGSADGGSRAVSAKRMRTRVLLGLALGVTAWLLSGWLVAVALLPAVLGGLPVLLARTDTDAGVRRLEALEEWTRHLAGVLDVGVGLEQAIMVNLRSTPTAIRPQVQTLVARLSARWPTEAALRAFADELDDATGDLVAASLILGARRRGAGLTRVLQGLAETVADEVRMRRAVEADRAKPRTTARAVTGITLAVLGLLAFNTTYIAPYGTALGQAVLTLLLGAYAGALVWMRMITKGRPTARFLPSAQAGTSSADPVAGPSGTVAVS